MKTEILLAMKALAEIFPQTLTDQLVHLWCRLLSDLSDEELARGVTAFIRDPESEFFPKPGQIYGFARPQGDKEEEAALVVDRIFYALGAYGKDSLGEKRAKDKIGELGWSYVVNRGGWNSFGNDIKNDDLFTAKSQIRKSIMGFMQRERNDKTMLVNLRSLGISMKELK